jgi:hypothetical protein
MAVREIQAPESGLQAKSSIPGRIRCAEVRELRVTER